MELQVNEADLLRMSQSRMDMLGLYGAIDNKRPAAWVTYGYKTDLTFDDYRRAYERSGAASGAVHRLLDKCWQDNPRIKKPGADEESPWEKKVAKTLEDIGAWQKLVDFDRRNMVGRYAGLIYRVADSKQLNEPLGQGKLVDLVPLYESQIKVLKWNEDATSENYGKPEMFQVETAPPTQRDDQARPRTWIKVHPSRVQILAEGAVGSNFFEGVPLLQAGFNALVDLEKITGGSAEGFLKNSARTIVFEYDPAASVQAAVQAGQTSGGTKGVREYHEDQTRALNRNQDSSIVVQGGKANTLPVQGVDPSKPFEVAACVFAASVRIPFTILFGQQTGRLASDEDQKDWGGRCQSRRANLLTPAMKEFVQRMQACGALEQGEFEIEWLPLDEPTDDARADRLSKLATAMKAFFDAGGAETLFDRSELRGVMKFEDKDPDDEFREGDPTAPPPARIAAPMPGPAPRPALKAAA